MKRAKSKQDKDWERYLLYLRKHDQRRYAVMRTYDLMLQLCYQDWENGEKDHLNRVIDGKPVNRIIEETIVKELNGAWPILNFTDFKKGFPDGFVLNR